MKSLSLIRILSFTLAFALIPLISAALSEDALDRTFSQNLETPAVPKKAEQFVRVHMDQVRRNLVKNGLEVTGIRDGEVLQVTIPCDQLFGIGSVELKQSAAEILRKLSIVVRDPVKYKILVSVHTDDTGDELYADSISAARANAIDDGLWQIASERETNVIPYGLGKDEPLVANTSRSNRAKNRRVEIYIVPEIGLIEMSGIKIKK